MTTAFKNGSMPFPEEYTEGRQGHRTRMTYALSVPPDKPLTFNGLRRRLVNGAYIVTLVF
jgi:hypothetical protein